VAPAGAPGVAPAIDVPPVIELQHVGGGGSDVEAPAQLQRAVLVQGPGRAYSVAVQEGHAPVGAASAASGPGP